MYLGDPSGVTKTDPSYTGGDFVDMSGQSPDTRTYNPQIPLLSTAGGLTTGQILLIAAALYLIFKG